jgi:hypothetical protein
MILSTSLFIRCKTASAITDKRAAVGISFYESMQLAIHKKICKACVCYEKQSKFLEAITARINSNVSEKHQLPDEVRLRILRALTEN